MKRFVKEYANHRLADVPFSKDDARYQLYIYRINKAVEMCENGFITINEAMEMILNATEYTFKEFKERNTKGAGTELVKAYLGKRTI